MHFNILCRVWQTNELLEDIYHTHTQTHTNVYIHRSIMRFSFIWPQWFLLSHRNLMHIPASSYFHLCWGKIKIYLACFKWRQTVCQHHATKAESSVLGFVFSVFIVLGELQTKVDQKEQNEHGEYVLDVLDVNNIEKFKINPYKYTYSVCI